MKSQSTDKEIVRQPGILIWHGTPSDHSGAYHVILSVGIDGTPVEVGIENPDCCRLEIPGLLDSGWDPEPEKVVAEFFESAETCRPKNGIYFDQERVNTVGELAEQLSFFSPELEAFFNEPTSVPSNIDTDGSLLIYSRIENRIESDLYREFFDPEEDMMEKLGARFSMIRQFMTSGSDADGFIQFITGEDWMRIDEFTDIFSWWLWDSPDRLVRRISDG
ncbi:hypothetical protein QUF80_19330 [Desulfococcaceae bacterium HSG8]|nr:hypothetical protein [Desulfococcaceae bacterium HSG8]